MKKLLFPLSAIGIYFFVFSVSVGTSSCEKEQIYVHDTTHVTVRDTIIREVCPPSIVGIWIGTYTVDQLPNDPARYYSLILKPNGTVIVETQPTGGNYFLGTGTWVLNGNKLTCNYVYPAAPQGYAVSQSATATYDNVNGKLTSGVWSDNGAPGGSGKFTVNKVQ
jgi:hypothetical protein